MEAWQDPDSEYLNCIGVGDTYVKRQIERILNRHKLNAKYICYDQNLYNTDKGIDVWGKDFNFVEKETE